MVVGKHGNNYNPPHTHNELIIEGLEEALRLNKDPAVAAKLQGLVEMAEGLESYLIKMSPEETPLQKAIREETFGGDLGKRYKDETGNKFETAKINLRDAAQFEKMIVEIGKFSRILEIGLFTGYTAALFCSIPTVSQVTSLEIDPFSVKYVRSRLSGTEEGKKLRIIEGPALESLKTLKEQGETYDVAFIDADKENYLNYYKFIMDNNLVGSGGLIIADNTLFKGQMYPTPHGSMGQVAADFNNYVAKDDRVTQVILQLLDGVSLIRRK